MSKRTVRYLDFEIGDSKAHHNFHMTRREVKVLVKNLTAWLEGKETAFEFNERAAQ
jgi:hypothetical protein